MSVARPLRCGLRAALVLCGAVCVLGTPGTRAARAGDVVVTSPGIGCRSAAALAALTMHGGDSRTHRADPSPSDLQTAREGGCRDLVPGQRLSVLRAFRNTAIVIADRQRDGGYGVLVVPSIDLRPAGLQAADRPAAAPVDPAGGASVGHDPQALSEAMGLPLRQVADRYPAIRCYQTSCDFRAGDTPQPLCPAAARCTNLELFLGGGGVVVGFSADLGPDDWRHSLERTIAAFGQPRHSANRADGTIRMRTDSLGWTVAGLEIDYLLYSGRDSFGHGINKHTILVTPAEN